MTVTTSLAAGIESANTEFGTFLDQLSDRIKNGEKLLADGAAFENLLLDELRQAGETSHLSLSVVDLTHDDVPSAPPWEPLEAGAIGLLDGGLSQQNGVVYSRAGEMAYALSAVDGSALTPASDGLHAEQHLRVVFGEDVHKTLNADVHDRHCQPLPSSDGLLTPWTMEAHHPLVDDPTSNVTMEGPFLDLPMDHVFYNGEGRPITLASIDNSSVSLAAEGDKIILPDGAIFDYDPWQVSIEGMSEPWGSGASFDGIGKVAASAVIEGELA